METVEPNRCEARPPVQRGRDAGLRRTLLAGVALFWVGSWGAAVALPENTGAESLSNWQYCQPVLLPAKMASPWVDVVLDPSVFSGARYDLADLRLYDGAGREVPYALRVRRPEYRQDVVPAHEFNRLRGPGETHEVSLELEPRGAEHNEVQVELPGIDFRRHAKLEGSEDGNQWRPLAEKELIHFRVGDKELEDLRLTYPPSRFRYLRLRVDPDPVRPKDSVGLGSVKVLRRVEVPGEMLTLEGSLEAREPVRTVSGPGSAWVIGLGGDSVPCEQIEVTIHDREFVRDYEVQAAGPPNSEERFRTVHRGTWQRRAGEEQRPMVASFSEVRASRLRLQVVDHRNPPLDIRAVRFSAPAREVVLARPKAAKPELRLYYGNPEAEAPHYDFAGNLPPRLEPVPARAKLGPRQENPTYLPRPLPLTERWPWLIYVVLGSVSLLLAAMIASVARTAIAIHDAAGKAQGECEVTSGE